MGVVRVGDGGLGDQVADGHEGVEPFGDGPGEALFLCLVLDVAGGEVDGEDVCCGWVSVGSLMLFVSSFLILG